MSRGVATICSVNWCAVCCLTISICPRRQNCDAWRWIVSRNRLRRGVTRRRQCTVSTIWAITTQAFLCSRNSHQTPRNSHDFFENSHDESETAKTPIKTPINSHWATDFFCRPFFVRNFALSTNGNRDWQALFNLLTQRTRQEGLAEEKLFSLGRTTCVRAQTLILTLRQTIKQL